MSTFMRIWNERVKPLAQKCYLDPETYRLHYKCMLGIRLVGKEKTFYDEQRLIYHDIWMGYNIQNMVNRVDMLLGK